MIKRTQSPKELIQSGKSKKEATQKGGIKNHHEKILNSNSYETFLISLRTLL